ncbi:MAG: cobalamin biosynthesis protein, partial [Nitrospira sp.]
MTVDRKTFAVYAITKHGVAIASRLLPHLIDTDLFVSEKLIASASPSARRLPLPMGPTLIETFTAYDCHVFIISIGAVVRMVAPLLKSKKVDPAVVCIDDAARFSICVLSGHVGRGNSFTGRIAVALGAQSVVTTASDAIGTLTVDILGRDLGWTLDDMDRNVTRGCAAVVNATKVLFVQETGEPDWWPAGKPLPEGVRYATSLEGVDSEAFEILLIATDREIGLSHPAHWENAVIYRPKSLVLGIGCDRGTAPDLVDRGVLAILAKQGLSPKSVKERATIDVKKDEVALLALSEKYGWPLRTYSP